MDASNRMLAAVKRIKSSVASTANKTFGRVRGFRGSFNDRTSLLQAAAPPSPEPVLELELESASVTTAGAQFDIEAVTSETHAAAGDGEGDGGRDSGGGGEDSRGDGGGGQGEEPTAQVAEAKRMAKTVHTVCVFAASASLLLSVNLPSKPGSVAGAVLYNVNIAFICLGLFTSLILSMFSIVKSGGTDPDVARVQKQAMVMVVAFVLVSFTLRMCMMLPPALLVVFVLLAGAVTVYLALTWKFGGGRDAEIARVSGGNAGVADRG